MENRTIGIIVGGMVLVILALIGMNIYNNSQNIQRDEYVAGHCKVISGSAANLYDAQVRYNCAGGK